LQIKDEPVSPENFSRKKRHDSSNSDTSSPGRNRHDSDESPPRRRHDSSNSDASPPRRPNKSEDNSPVRKRAKESPSRRTLREDSDSDISPTRKRNRENEFQIKQEIDDDLSPPRQIKEEPDSDTSPPRRIKEEADSDLSPPRPSSSGASSKTLGGKKAGLQDAKSMKEEMLKLKKKEKQTFEKVTI
jgi:pre-mRNA-splicing factor CWC26